MRINHLKINMIHKLFIYLFVACILPMMLYGVFAYHKTNTVINNEINKSMQDLISNKQKNIEMTMQNIESLILNVSNLDDIRDVLINDYDNNSYNKLAAQAKIGYILSSYSNLRGLVSIDLFSMKGAHYHVGDTLNYEDIENDLTARLFEETFNADREIVWNGIEDNVNIKSTFKKVITASKIIRTVDPNMMTEKAIGFIIVNYDVDAFTANIGGSSFEEAVYIIIDSKDRIVYHPDKNMVGKQVNPTFIKKVNKDSDHFVDRINGEKMIVTYFKSKKTNWKIISFVPIKSIHAKTSVISSNMVLLVMVCFFMLILFAFLISKKYLSPIKKITELFKQLQKDNIDLSTRLEVVSNDEIGELVIWFNAFLDSIKEKKIMQQEILQREKLLKGIADATNVLLGTTEYEKAFNEALRILGSITNVDRVYIFQNHINPDSGDLLYSQRFSWCKEGVIPRIGTGMLQNLSYMEAGFSYWYDKLSSARNISSFTQDLPKAEREIFEHLGIIAILAVPIFIDSHFWGFMSFHDCSTGRTWSKVEEDTLRIAATSIGGAFKRIEAENALQNILKDDFRKTIQNLQNLIFKVELNEEGDRILTLFEGKIAAEVGLNTIIVFGKTSGEIFADERAEYLDRHFMKAFEGKVNTLDVKIEDRIFYVTLSPIVENGTVNEVVGSAIDITQQRRAEEKIRYMAYYDALTGLPNRAFFSECLTNMIARGNSARGAILFLDLDQFKLVNDTLGHAAGDDLLKKVAGRLEKCLGPQDTISRRGGDEFTILLPQVSGKQDVIVFAQKVIDAFRHAFVINQYEFFVSTSIGISIYPDDGKDMETLLKNADIAMYRAKENGRNNFQFYTCNMNSYAIERLNMENNLRKAIENNEFLIHYQPKIDLKTRRMIGCEALIRWNHPDLGLIPPNTFIPVAEETGLIAPIGEWVLETSCRQSKLWHDAGYTQLNISVNISAKQFQYQNIIETISRILKETGLSSEYLELEITENCIMQNTDRTISIIDELKSIGVKISIDDFGTGFSSMGYLKRFAVNKLKIDKSFIINISSNSSDAAIASAIISMAHSLNLQVIAEGVETNEQLQLLESYNCDEVQGYLFSKPLNTEEFTCYLEKNNFAVNSD